MFVLLERDGASNSKQCPCTNIARTGNPYERSRPVFHKSPTMFCLFVFFCPRLEASCRGHDTWSNRFQPDRDPTTSWFMLLAFGSMRNRWTEHDKKLAAKSPEKATQTSASPSPVGSSPPATSATAAATSPAEQSAQHAQNGTASWWSDARAAAGARDCCHNAFGQRASRESSMSYY